MIMVGRSRLLRAGSYLLALGFLASGGCSSADKPGTPQAPVVAKAGARLWAENCAHCHSSRPPTAYSDGEWDVVMLHMRVRGNLTAEEHRKIAEFLKLSN
jgi:hypothetical protein